MGLDTNIQGIGVHGAASLVATGITGGAVNAEDFDFGQDSFAAAANSNITVGGFTGTHPTQADPLAIVLTGGQSGIRVSNITTGTFTNIIVHDTLGFGDQCGGSSTNVTESYFLEYNIRATTGRSDWVTDSVPGGGGSLFNAGDGNGGCTNLIKTHVTSYNVPAAWQTLENGSPYAVNATLKYSIGDNSIGVRPDNTVATTGSSTNGDYILLNRFESQPQAPGSWTGNWFIPNALQTTAFNWSNSSDGDHATAFVQMDVNTGGSGNIFSTTSPFVNPGIGNFALTAGTPGIGQSGDSGGANPGYDQTSGTATACGTPTSIAVAEAYPNQTQFGFNTVQGGPLRCLQGCRHLCRQLAAISCARFCHLGGIRTIFGFDCVDGRNDSISDPRRYRRKRHLRTADRPRLLRCVERDGQLRRRDEPGLCDDRHCGHADPDCNACLWDILIDTECYPRDDGWQRTDLLHA